MSGDTLTFRVERTEWAVIEIDVPKLIEEWGEPGEDDSTAAFVDDVLREIGVQELLYGGDFVRVMDRDTVETIGAS